MNMRIMTIDGNEMYVADRSAREKELIPVNSSQASFYRKAFVRTVNGKTVLRSYSTDVCMIYEGKVYRLWAGYSSTTLRHVNEFLLQHGFETVSKSAWNDLPFSKNGISLVDEIMDYRKTYGAA